MKIALIKCGSHLPTDGVRLVSALLKKAGHTVYFVFLPETSFQLQYDIGFAPLKQILTQCDLALFSVYSLESNMAAKISDHIHKVFPSMPVVWGGPHCISAPEMSLRHADAVCFGEAEQCLTDYITAVEQGIQYPEIGNMAFTIYGKVVINKPLPPFHDLDSLPYYDYDLENKYVLEKDLFAMDKELFRKSFTSYPFGNPTLSILTSRGCPHSCSYCNNSRYISLFGKNSIRKQTVSRFMDELEAIVNKYDFFTGIFFGDDDFFVRTPNEIHEFAERYKKNVNLPFAIATSGNTFRKEKFLPLLDCGLKRLVMGVQTADDRVLKEIYNRNIDPQKTATIATQAARYHKTHGLQVYLDFIADNPYETRPEILASYLFMIRLPKHIRFQIHNLVFFPGTPLYEKAVKDKIIKPLDESEFRSYHDSVHYQCHYEMLLFVIAGQLGKSELRGYVPRFALNFLAWKPIRLFMNMIPQSVMRACIRNIPLVLEKIFLQVHAIVKGNRKVL